MKFYPYEKRGGGAEKVLAIPKGGHKKFWGSFNAVSFGLIEGGGGGHEKFPLFKRGRGAKTFTVLRGGGNAKSFGPVIFPLCSPPPRN